ncbi:hypothetical protein KC363_g5503 [Hortaea werneckii]|uniref:Mis12 domain-containing protein n=1 Tax=Hortaea werneckii TaxID=91943 RepID=A0A3M7FHW3_HORWE|nr:hypothetical protein KC361_g2076 [Hortaea werneckii]KAI7188355.1 hypothetical protein KC363_g5503 [Hortaea werneckii]RMY88429.1 hypothetical protein D0861_04823 [Hortaea werneckii]
MATSHQIQNALLTEHFRYTPLTLLDDIINTVNELVFRAINAIDEGLSSAPPEVLGFRLQQDRAATLPNEESRKDALLELKQNEIDNGIVQLESLLNATVDKDFDKFEIYTLRNILAVGHGEEARDLASWVQLEHYKNLDLTGSKEAPKPEEVQLQRRKLQESRKLNIMLKAEEARNTAILHQLRSMTGVKSEESGEAPASSSPFAFLTSSQHTSTSSSSQPLTQNVQYALSHLPALRQHLAQLKESLHVLPNARHTREDDESKEAKRRRYLDTQAQAAMDRKGVVADEATRAAATAGRRVGREEVEGLEAVAQALSGADEETDLNNEAQEQ